MAALPVYRFGEFLLDPGARTLLRNGTRLALPAKSFDCVLYLLEHRERAIGRDELIAAVWGRVDASDSVLSQTILYARRALEDTGREQHCIRTVVRFGYHWVMPVEVVVAGAASSEPAQAAAPAVRDASDQAALAPSPVSAARSRRPRLALAFAGVAALVIVCAAIAWRVRDRDAQPTSTPPPPGAALVVLPVSIPEADGEPWMRLGVMDRVAERLAASGQTVAPSENVVQLAQTFDITDRGELAQLAASAAAGSIVQPRATRESGRWHVLLRVVFGAHADLRAHGEGDAVLAAAAAAADDLSAQLGLRAAPTDSEPAATRELLAKVRAATLQERFDDARALVAQAGAEGTQDAQLGFRLAKIDLLSGHLDDAETRLLGLLDQNAGRSDPAQRARIVDALGVVASRRGLPAKAEPLHDEAIGLLRGRGIDSDQLGKALVNRGAARFAQHKDAAAFEDFAAARIALAGAGDVLSLTYLDSNLGAADMDRGRYVEAAAAFARAAQRFEKLRIPAAALNGWDAAAQAHLILLDAPAALAIEPRLAELVPRVAMPAQRLGAELTRVEILAAGGRMQAARALLGALREDIARGSDDPAFAGRADAIEARFLLADGDAVAAAPKAAAAFAALSKIDDSRQRVRNWLVLVQAEAAAGQGARLRESGQRIAEAAAGSGDAGERLYAELIGAQILAANGAAEAGAAFERCLATAEAGRVPLDVLAVSAAYADWLLANRQNERAGAIVERLAPWAAQSYDVTLLQLRFYHAVGATAAWQHALVRARELAGERGIPAQLALTP